MKNPLIFSFKVNTFKKTINIIKELEFEIKDAQQLKSIKGIGKASTMDRIQEILNTGNLKENKTVSKNKIILMTLINLKQLLELVIKKIKTINRKNKF